MESNIDCTEDSLGSGKGHISENQQTGHKLDSSPELKSAKREMNDLSEGQGECMESIKISIQTDYSLPPEVSNGLEENQKVHHYTVDSSAQKNTSGGEVNNLFKVSVRNPTPLSLGKIDVQEATSKHEIADLISNPIPKERISVDGSLDQKMFSSQLPSDDANCKMDSITGIDMKFESTAYNKMMLQTYAGGHVDKKSNRVFNSSNTCVNDESSVIICSSTSQVFNNLATKTRDDNVNVTLDHIASTSDSSGKSTLLEFQVQTSVVDQNICCQNNKPENSSCDTVLMNKSKSSTNLDEDNGKIVQNTSPYAEDDSFSFLAADDFLILDETTCSLGRKYHGKIVQNSLLYTEDDSFIAADDLLILDETTCSFGNMSLNISGNGDVFEENVREELAALGEQKKAGSLSYVDTGNKKHFQEDVKTAKSLDQNVIATANLGKNKKGGSQLLLSDKDITHRRLENWNTLSELISCKTTDYRKEFGPQKQILDKSYRITGFQRFKDFSFTRSTSNDVLELFGRLPATLPEDLEDIPISEVDIADFESKKNKAKELDKLCQNQKQNK